MPVPDDRRYADSHEWHKIEGELVVIGITQFAADELTDITYADLPAVGAKVTAGQPFGELESVKATAELYSAVTGTVADVNGVLEDDPGLINRDPYGQGWMIKVAGADLNALERLKTAAQYDASLKA